MKRCFFKRSGAVINLAVNGIKPCCFNKSPILSKIRGDKNNPAEIAKDVIRKRKKLFTMWQENQPDECSSCPLLLETENYDDHVVSIIVNCYTVCNSKCIYCGIRNGVFYYKAGPIIQALVAMPDLLSNKVHLIWAGGEPSLYPSYDFEIACDAIKSVNGEISVKTNGIKFSPHIAKLLSSYKKSNITCSLDAGDRNSFKLVKGVDKFDQVVENLKRYADIAVNRNQVVLKFITLIENINSFERFLELCQKNNFQYVLTCDFRNPPKE